MRSQAWSRGFAACLALVCAFAAPSSSHAAGHPAKRLHPAKALAIGRCYGRFIAWRDALGAEMTETGSYTPAAGAAERFEVVENAFTRTLLRERRLRLRVIPSFAEADLPPDVRTAFRQGLSETNQRLGDPALSAAEGQLMIDAELTPQAKMARSELLIDTAFDALGQPCDALARRLLRAAPPPAR